MLLYHGGTLFGRAVNDSLSLAETALMVVCLHGGPLDVTSFEVNSIFIREVIGATAYGIIFS